MPRLIARMVWLLQNAMMPSETQTVAPSGKIPARGSQLIIFYLFCLGFMLNGIIITFVGPMLTVLKAKWLLNDGQAGLFSLAQFAASLVGVLASSPLMSKKGFKPAIVAGIAMQGMASHYLNAPTFHLALFACAVFRTRLRFRDARHQSLGRRILRRPSSHCSQHHQSRLGRRSNLFIPASSDDRSHRSAFLRCYTSSAPRASFLLSLCCRCNSASRCSRILLLTEQPSAKPPASDSPRFSEFYFSFMSVQKTAHLTGRPTTRTAPLPGPPIPSPSLPCFSLPGFSRDAEPRPRFFCESRNQASLFVGNPS